MSEEQRSDIGAQDPAGGKAPSGLASLFGEAVSLLREAGPWLASAAGSLADLAGRLETETFHLAVLGQFKRGKSTLLNALLRCEVLPSSVVPLTAIPTFVRWGERPLVRVVFDGDRPDRDIPADSPEELSGHLAAFVTEESNPENRLGVLQAEVFLPEDILSRGLVLIDTPGIGSTYQHNTETTLNFLPQCDAALFLVSADPPVTEVELSFLEEVRKVVPHLVFVFNKVDYLRPADRDRALAFFREVLVREAGFREEPEVFPLSALQGLDGCLAGDDGLVDSSGLRAVRDHLLDFLMTGKSRVLSRAVSARAAAVLSEARIQVDLTIRSLIMPMENLADRLQSLEERIGEAERQRETAGDLLAGDRRRAVKLLEEQAADLRERARRHMEKVVATALAGSGDTSSQEAVARAALDDAIPGFFEHHLGAVSREFDNYVAEVLEPHRRRADELIEGVRAAASELFDIPHGAPESSGRFEARSQPYWVSRKWNTSMNPVPAGLLDFALPAGMRRSAITRRVMAQVDDLVIHNVENLRWATLQNLDSAFRGFAASLDARLADTVKATHGAITAVMDDRQQHANRAADRLPALELLAGRIAALAGRFDPGDNK